jgi:hypothetical protein
MVVPLGVRRLLARSCLEDERRVLPGGPADHHRPGGKNAILIVEFAKELHEHGRA